LKVHTIWLVAFHTLSTFKILDKHHRLLNLEPCLTKYRCQGYLTNANGFITLAWCAGDRLSHTKYRIICNSPEHSHDDSFSLWTENVYTAPVLKHKARVNMTTHHIFPRSVHYLRVTCHSIVFGCKRCAPSLHAYSHSSSFQENIEQY